jgi:hypothetical protein
VGKGLSVEPRGLKLGKQYFNIISKRDMCISVYPKFWKGKACKRDAG